MSNEAPLFIQYYTDEHIIPQLARILRTRGYVAQSAIEAGMIGRSDEEHLDQVVFLQRFGAHRPRTAEIRAE